MRRSIAAVLALTLSAPLLAASNAPRGVVALGVGATSSTDIVVKIDGKNTSVKLAGLPGGGTYAAQAFLQCLVEKRVLRVDRAAGRATMLDGTSVADHVAEFLQTRTQTDPCTLGKAAYVPGVAPVAAVPAPAAAAKPAPARGHVSFGSSGAPAQSSGGRYLGPGASGKAAAPRRPGAASPAESDTPTMTGTVYQPQSGTVYQPQAGSTTTVGTATPYTPSQAQTYTPPTATTTIPTTTTNPP